MKLERRDQRRRSGGTRDRDARSRGGGGSPRGGRGEPRDDSVAQRRFQGGRGPAYGKGRYRGGPRSFKAFETRKVKPSASLVNLGLDPLAMVVLEPPRPGGYGTPPAERSLEELLQFGMVILDKPAGPTSHQVAAWIREALRLEKAGHGGTLDPQVSGVLPLALERATRCVKAFLHAPKEYVCVLELGKVVDQGSIETVMEEFRGPVWQLPPLEAAVKRQLRLRHIYELELLEIKGKLVLFRVRCEAGTYIRNLCRDMGDLLVVGGHMAQLRRTATGPFTEAHCVNLVALRDAYEEWREFKDESLLKPLLHAPEELFDKLFKIVVRDTAVDALCHGAPLALPGVTEVSRDLQRGSLVAFFTQSGELIGQGTAALSGSEIIKAHEEHRPGLVAAPQQVYMPVSRYPRVWKSKER